MRGWKIAAMIVGVVVLAGAGLGASIVKHNADVKHDREARAERIRAQREAAYQARVRAWHSEHDAWQTKQTAYDDCKDNSDAAFSALDDIDGQITGGLNYTEYSDAVADVSSAVHRAIREGDLACSAVTLALARASDHYADAATTWRKWYNNPVGSIDDVNLDPDWRKAAESVGDAEGALNDMEPGPEPERPVRGEPVKIQI